MDALPVRFVLFVQRNACEARTRIKRLSFLLFHSRTTGCPGSCYESLDDGVGFPITRSLHSDVVSFKVNFS